MSLIPSRKQFIRRPRLDVLSLTVTIVEEPSTLREFIATLGEDILYAFDRKMVGVLVNDRCLCSSARLKPGDSVVFPVIVGS